MYLTQNIGWNSFLGSLPGGDIIHVTIEANVTADPLIVEIILKSAHNVNWWKAIAVTYFTMPGFQLHLHGEIWNQDQTKSNKIDIPANLMKMGGTLEFKKAKGLGVHTGMYLLADFNTIQPGTRITFTWVKD